MDVIGVTEVAEVGVVVVLPLGILEDVEEGATSRDWIVFISMSISVEKDKSFPLGDSFSLWTGI